MGGQPGRQDRGGAGGLEREKWERRRRDMEKRGQQEKRMREKERSESKQKVQSRRGRKAGRGLAGPALLTGAAQSQSDKDTEKLPWPRTHGSL